MSSGRDSAHIASAHPREADLNQLIAGYSFVRIPAFFEGRIRAFVITATR
jgi:hypothetical protein